jgi:hypothetical protein
MKLFGFSLVFTGALLISGAAPMIADDWDQLTKVTFSGPVEVPGRVLPAGTYYFKLLDSPSDRDIVQILSEDKKHLIEMVLAVPDERFRASGKAVIQFSEQPAGSPEAVKAWFYAGSKYGLEFVYPYDRAVQLAKSSKEPVYSTREDLSPYATEELKTGKEPQAMKMKHSAIKAVQPNGEETDLPNHQ